MTIAIGKKRFYLTLNEANYDQFRHMLKSLGAPAGTDALLINEFISGMVQFICPVIQKAKDSGKPMTMIDFYAMVGNMMKDAQDEQLPLM